MSEKLSLKKETIAKLGADSLSSLHGGNNTADNCVLQTQNCNQSAVCTTTTNGNTNLSTTQYICFTFKGVDWDCGEPGATNKSCAAWPICIEL